MTPQALLDLLRDPAVATELRRLPWQYVGGGIPVGMSTLGVLNATHTNSAAGGRLHPDDRAAIVRELAAALRPELAAAARDGAAQALDAATVDITVPEAG